ncbi:hypothetical protein JTY56_gp48 [Xanthomonas phage Bosa]|uniref:Uncharacterized protein n=1 Tax=Xanthomonas phage Bosa TaxID=2674976 RepID=A0A679KD92_9CAUD|nr:hypothetical protein JTY56_gp48 [Xanthomonas phage Bosa]ATS92248.1 hypothetical protein [Stenotrophomonas phage DLP4]CAA2409897.1 hypothetical protein [Xanthomonas phage Bosa]
MSSNRNDSLELLARLLTGDVCPHEIKLQQVTALLGVVASRTPGGLTVSTAELAEIGGKFIGITQDSDTGDIRITAGEPPADQPHPTHAAPTTRQ